VKKKELKNEEQQSKGGGEKQETREKEKGGNTRKSPKKGIRKIVVLIKVDAKEEGQRLTDRGQIGRRTH